MNVKCILGEQYKMQLYRFIIKKKKKKKYYFYYYYFISINIIYYDVVLKYMPDLVQTVCTESGMDNTVGSM